MKRINLLLDRFEVLAAFLLVIALFIQWTQAFGMSISGISFSSIVYKTSSLKSALSADKSLDIVASIIKYLPIAIIIISSVIVVLRLMDLPSAIFSLVTGLACLIYTSVALYKLASNKLPLGIGIWLSIIASILLIVFSLRKKTYKTN